MNDSFSWPLLAQVASALCFFGLLLCGGGGILPFLLALKRVEIEVPARDAASPQPHVTLRGLDPTALLWTGAAAALLWPLAFALAGVWLGATCGLIGFALCWGCRVQLEVRANETRLRRLFAYVLPWSDHRSPEPARLSVDGWGDFADPESLWCTCGPHQVELAWNHAGSGVDFDAMAARFNAAAARPLSAPAT